MSSPKSRQWFLCSLALLRRLLTTQFMTGASLAELTAVLIPSSTSLTIFSSRSLFFSAVRHAEQSPTSISRAHWFPVGVPLRQKLDITSEYVFLLWIHYKPLRSQNTLHKLMIFLLSDDKGHNAQKRWTFHIRESASNIFSPPVTQPIIKNVEVRTCSDGSELVGDYLLSPSIKLTFAIVFINTPQAVFIVHGYFFVIVLAVHRLIQSQKQ